MKYAYVLLALMILTACGASGDDDSGSSIVADDTEGEPDDVEDDDSNVQDDSESDDSSDDIVDDTADDTADDDFDDTGDDFDDTADDTTDDTGDDDTELPTTTTTTVVTTSTTTTTTTTIPGTYTDGERMWQTDLAPEMVYPDALDYCMNSTFGGFTDWYLPTIDDLRSLVRGCPDIMTGGACGVTVSCLDSSCFNVDYCYLTCVDGGGPANGCYWPDEMGGSCATDYYYGSSSAEWGAPRGAWTLSFYYGAIQTTDSVASHVRVQCVRGL